METINIIIFGFVFWVLTAFIFVYSVYRAIQVFKRKKSSFFILLMTTLTCSMLFATFTMLIVSKTLFTAAIVLVSFANWMIMINGCTWLYSLRIQHIKLYQKFDSIAKVIPWVVLVTTTVMTVFSVVEYFKGSLIPGGLLSHRIGIGISVELSIVEIFLCIVLIQKVKVLMQNKRHAKYKIGRCLIAGLVFLIIIDILLLISKFLYPNADVFLRSFSYLLKLCFIIHFFDSLIFELNRDVELNDTYFNLLPLEHENLEFPEGYQI